ncbi:MAG: hypothetical protein JNK79_10915 [Chitinophagaceae bacterium]|nr:hypothetical protein [Chitinophagaceae bacterium]
MKYLIVLIAFISPSCKEKKTPIDQILEYAEKKYGSNLDGKEIDLKDVFPFRWEEAYIFVGLMDPSVVMEKAGITYDGDIVPDDTELFLFIGEGRILKEYNYQDFRLMFNYKPRGQGFYKIVRDDSRFKIEVLGKDNYSLRKVN